MFDNGLRSASDAAAVGAIEDLARSAIASRTDLIRDAAALDLIDSAIAEHALSWGVLSAYKIERAIDAWGDRYEPGAVHQTRTRAQDRAVRVGSRHDGSGITGISGRLCATDAVGDSRASLDSKLLVPSLCVPTRERVGPVRELADDRADARARGAQPAILLR